ncbi:RNA polymerase sigma-70 factor, ECF subfamily [Polaromonas sp. YR568]|uniref:sigma-70 family RNA polymerase sigma factor n=1 Tax=Polaromonas sp. YR568 TaxID=1855301 RepID=UPI0008E016A2|nr:sigma-70 family RNA polymerase sigma factor [Polaromonas sp. YR568]SFU77756.1 RNA polymerase sigma-70 factor, ECF subfamily [Polaromonas sp. YR568]
MLERYYQELLNFCSRTVRNRDAAADIVQETYARVLAVQHSGQAVPEPRALLYRTARNLQIDQHRRNEVRGEALHPDAETAAAELDNLAAPQAFEPDAAAASAQGVNALLAAIDALPLRCREAFILHKFDGLPHSEVAEQMGISRKMVEQHIKLAMDACRRCQDTPGGAAAPAAPILRRRKTARE